MNPDRVDIVTVWLWRVVAFELGFLLMATPYHVDGWVRAWWGQP